MNAAAETRFKCGPDGLNRSWEIVGWYSTGKEKRPKDAVKILDLDILQVDERMPDDSLILVRSICASEHSLYQIYRIYQRSGNTLPMISDDSPAGGGAEPWRLGGKGDWKSCKWEWNPSNGIISNHPAKISMASPDYSLKPEFPGYFEAILFNWTWEEHFQYAAANLMPQFMKEIVTAGLPNPYLACSALRYFYQVNQDLAQGAEYKDRAEKAEAAVQTVGNVLISLAYEDDDENHLAILAKWRRPDVRHHGLGLCHSMAEILAACHPIDSDLQAHYKAGESIWLFKLPE